MKPAHVLVGLFPPRPFTFAVGLALYLTGAALACNQEIGVDPFGVAIQSVGLPLIVYAIDAPMSWFPDAKRLAYVKLVRRHELPIPPIGLEYFGQYFGNQWDEVPAVYVFDFESGQSSFVHVGWVPVVSLDGRTILVGGWDANSGFSWNLFDVASRESKPVRWPDDTGNVIGVLADNVVLYRGSTAAESLAVKAAVIDSAEAQTLVPAIDRHDLLSFGRILKK